MRFADTLAGGLTDARLKTGVAPEVPVTTPYSACWCVDGADMLAGSTLVVSRRADGVDDALCTNVDAGCRP